LFLARNGWRLTASQASAIDTMLAVAASEMGIEALSGWIRDNSAQT